MKLDKILKQPEWILDGNYSRTFEQRLKEADTVFLFDIPAEDCLEGAAARIGKPKEDLPWQETEFDPEFRKYIETFNKEILPGMLLTLANNNENKQVIRFTSRKQADQFIEKFLLQ